MPFGLKNTPATFNRAMYRVLEVQEEYSLAYVDDVIIFSNSWDEHVQHIQLVLEALWKYGLNVKASSVGCKVFGISWS